MDNNQEPSNEPCALDPYWVLKKTPPLSFRIQLITEVQKHPIIWQNLRGPKNKDFLDDAWRQVRKELKIQEGTPLYCPGFCVDHWKLLIHNYRSHINRSTAMHPALVENMEFMKPQLKKSADSNTSSNKPKEQSASKEQKVPITTPMPQNASPGVAKCISVKPPERAVSVAIINYLFDSLPPEAMTQVCNSLIQVLHSLRPNVSPEILEYGRKQPDLLNIDWSGLSIPEEICSEVWKRDVYERLQSSWNKTSSG